MLVEQARSCRGRAWLSRAAAEQRLRRCAPSSFALTQPSARPPRRGRLSRTRCALQAMTKELVTFTDTQPLKCVTRARLRAQLRDHALRTTSHSAACACNRRDAMQQMLSQKVSGAPVLNAAGKLVCCSARAAVRVVRRACADRARRVFHAGGRAF
jgi:hypothetical protein